MITSKVELKDYLDKDRVALGIKSMFPAILINDILKFQTSLRYYEYFLNRKRRIRKAIWHLINHHYAVKLGFTIPPNTCGKGLNIHHYGCIVINKNARIGENCNIQQCVNIGQNYGETNAPTIGNNVYIGPGAKIFGKIYIADGCAIGANAVVNRSFDKPNMTIVGVPAREIGARKEGLK